MRDAGFFQAALGLSSPWIVLRSEFDRDQKQLDLHIGFARGSRFACPACGAEEYVRLQRVGVILTEAVDRRELMGRVRLEASKEPTFDVATEPGLRR
jgi:hypothetical protein